MDAQQPWKKKGGTTSWMAAAGALESGDSEPCLQLEYSCTNSTNQIAHCEVSKSHSETSYGVSLLSPQGTVPVKVIVYCQLQPRALRFLNRVDPLVSVSNLYLLCGHAYRCLPATLSTLRSQL